MGVVFACTWAVLFLSFCILSELPSVWGGFVGHLPGFGSPPTAHYSGFVEVDALSGTNLFYYLVESQNDPSHAPLLWWMNGGPGASSLAGLLGENGPVLLVEKGTLINNPYAWNSNANVLYVEFGPGIGYSYCANSSKTDVDCPQHREDCSPCAASDTSVASQSVSLIEALLTDVFPQFQGRPLYLAGESYAGVYIPTLAAALIAHFKDTSIVNLTGLWVTDPCTDDDAQFGWLDISVKFCYQMGLIDSQHYGVLTGQCSSGRTRIGDRVRNETSAGCRRAWRLYDLATAGAGEAVHPRSVPGLPLYIDPLNVYGPSGSVDIPSYLNRSDVRQALHASQSPNAVYHLELGNNGYSNYEMEYSACNLEPHTNDSMLQVYLGLLASARSLPSAASLKRIIISSGDIDPVVALHGTEAAVRKLGLPKAPGGDRRPWFYNDTASPSELLAQKPVAWGQSLQSRQAGAQVGGFNVNFDTGVPGLSLDFVSVRASGHMVPAYAPKRALHVIAASLLEGRALAPRLPVGWDEQSDGDFYGWKTSDGGTFTHWVNAARTSAYINNEPSQFRDSVELVV